MMFKAYRQAQLGIADHLTDEQLCQGYGSLDVAEAALLDTLPADCWLLPTRVESWQSEERKGRSYYFVGKDYKSYRIDHYEYLEVS